MKLISWNVNGLRACVTKGFLEFFNEVDADFMCLQEIKMQQGQIDLDLKGYHQYFNYAQKKGYSGTAIFSKKEALSASYGIGIPYHDTEGRVITLEFEKFYMVTVYTPNSKSELARIEYRVEWEKEFRAYLKKLDENKPVILCGDLNVAHNPIDLKNPKANEKSAGYSPQEREQFNALLQEGFIDTYRFFYPEKEGAYTWWSYMFKARTNNSGWRIDYFLVSERLKEHLKDAYIYSDILGSDHCPVGIEIDL